MITDHEMPGLTGLELDQANARRLARFALHSGFRTLPGLKMETALIEAIRPGAVLAKPYVPAHLIADPWQTLLGIHVRT